MRINNATANGSETSVSPGKGLNDIVVEVTAEDGALKRRSLPISDQS